MSTTLYLLLVEPTSVVSVLMADSTTRSFGTSSINATPMSVTATLLPQAKLRFLGEQVSDPGLLDTDIRVEI